MLKVTNVEMNNAVIIWRNFVRLFPALEEHVISYERKGSKMISLLMDDGTTLYFIYYTPTNWNLGTKPWRMKPKALEATSEENDTKEEEAAE
jgi:hypothetical protein